MEYDSQGSLTKVLVRGSGYGGGIGSVIYTADDANGTNRRFFLYNALGSTSAMTNDAMTVTSTGSYDGWGKEIGSTGSSETDRKFCTKERSASIGLDYFGFRYYDYDLGRFSTRDPSGYPDGPNNYLYCSNDPVNKIDPLGLEEKSIVDIFVDNIPIISNLRFIQCGLDKAAKVTNSPTIGAVSGFVDNLVDANPVVQTGELVKNTAKVSKREGNVAATKYLANQTYEGIKEGAGTNDFVRMVDSEDKYSALEQTWYGIQGASKSFLLVVGGLNGFRTVKGKYGPGKGGAPKIETVVEEVKNPHGNSKSSTKPQHRYEIADEAGVQKTGISGKELNKNGTSGRANSQVNKLNKQAGYEKYKANVVEKDIPGRAKALEAEQAATNILAEEGHDLYLQTNPKPKVD